MEEYLIKNKEYWDQYKPALGRLVIDNKPIPMEAIKIIEKATEKLICALEYDIGEKSYL